MSLASLLSKLEAEGLAPDDIDAAFTTIMDGQAAHEDIKQFLRLSIPRMGEPAWLAGGARALRARMIAVAAPPQAIDVCGTGGDGAHTLNISTAVAFVVAGCGVPVAKHGNRAMSSKSGAADVLEALGVKLTGEPAVLERALQDARIAFLFAQHHHPAMRHVALARRELGQRTVFNLLGPLSNPASVRRQLLGVFSSAFLEPVALALHSLGAERALVVHGHGGLDELSAEGANSAVALGGGAPLAQTILPAHAGLPAAANDQLRGGDAAENAEALRSLLDGRRERAGYRTVVLLNAAAALVAAGVAADLSAGAQMAAASIDEGRAREALTALIAITNEAP